MSLRSYNYGGGVQSTALLVLVAAGRLPGGVFLFANTGDDSEDPRTLEYVRTVAGPSPRGTGWSSWCSSPRRRCSPGSSARTAT